MSKKYIDIILFLLLMSRTPVALAMRGSNSVPKALNFYKRCGFLEFETYMQRDKKQYIKNCIPMFLTI